MSTSLRQQRTHAFRSNTLSPATQQTQTVPLVLPQVTSEIPALRLKMGNCLTPRTKCSDMHICTSNVFAPYSWDLLNYKISNMCLATPTKRPCCSTCSASGCIRWAIPPDHCLTQTRPWPSLQTPPESRAKRGCWLFFFSTSNNGATFLHLCILKKLACVSHNLGISAPNVKCIKWRLFSPFWAAQAARDRVIQLKNRT